jgi:hypothetical protein
MSWLRTLLSFCLVFSYLELPSFAQVGIALPAIAIEHPKGTALVKGLTVYPNEPLQFDFIIEPIGTKGNQQTLREESLAMMKYFLASLTTSDKDMWVNLSPYEKGRIIPEALGATLMGRDLLAQDYILKQMTASLIHPDTPIGQQFWTKVYAKAKEEFGTTNIPLNTFNKVWITPDKATVWEHGNSVFVIERHLKVMLETDYLAQSKNVGAGSKPAQKRVGLEPTPAEKIGSDIIRQIVIPALEKEVNEGETFAQLRQIYNAMILATWYKKRLKDSLLGQAYVNKNKIQGVDTDIEAKEKIYAQYIQTFKKGVFNFIKEEPDPATGEMIPRKYFSGGMVGLNPAQLTIIEAPASRFDPKLLPSEAAMKVTFNADPVPVSPRQDKKSYWRMEVGRRIVMMFEEPQNFNAANYFYNIPEMARLINEPEGTSREKFLEEVIAVIEEAEQKGKLLSELDSFHHVKSKYYPRLKNLFSAAMIPEPNPYDELAEYIRELGGMNKRERGVVASSIVHVRVSPQFVMGRLMQNLISPEPPTEASEASFDWPKFRRNAREATLWAIKEYVRFHPQGKAAFEEHIGKETEKFKPNDALVNEKMSHIAMPDDTALFNLWLFVQVAKKFDQQAPYWWLPDIQKFIYPDKGPQDRVSQILYRQSIQAAMKTGDSGSAFTRDQLQLLENTFTLLERTAKAIDTNIRVLDIKEEEFQAIDQWVKKIALLKSFNAQEIDERLNQIDLLLLKLSRLLEDIAELELEEIKERRKMAIILQGTSLQMVDMMDSPTYDLRNAPRKIKSTLVGFRSVIKELKDGQPLGIYDVDVLNISFYPKVNAYFKLIKDILKPEEMSSDTAFIGGEAHGLPEKTYKFLWPLYEIIRDAVRSVKISLKSLRHKEDDSNENKAMKSQGALTLDVIRERIENYVFDGLVTTGGAWEVYEVKGHPEMPVIKIPLAMYRSDPKTVNAMKTLAFRASRYYGGLIGRMAVFSDITIQIKDYRGIIRKVKTPVAVVQERLTIREYDGRGGRRLITQLNERGIIYNDQIGANVGTDKDGNVVLADIGQPIFYKEEKDLKEFPVPLPEVPEMQNAAMNNELGGIDMSSENLELSIKRDSQGKLLPAHHQDWSQISLNGLEPVILRIEPFDSKAIFSYN